MSLMKENAVTQDDEQQLDEGRARGTRLQDLPTEILSIIVGYLDVRSKMYAWESCAQIKRALKCTSNVGSLNLKHSQRQPRYLGKFLRDNAVYITKLDLCGARGFAELDAVSAFLLMKNLRSLDVRHTVVSLTSASLVCAACPHLVHLSCNVTNCVTASAIESPTMRQSFRNLERVHFVVSKAFLLDILDALVLASNMVEYKLADGKIVRNCRKSFFRIFDKAQMVLPKLQFFSYIIKPLNPGVIRLFNLTWDYTIITDITRWMHCNLGSEQMPQNRHPLVEFDRKIVVSAWHPMLVTLNPELLHDLHCELSRNKTIVCGRRAVVPKDQKAVKCSICPCVLANLNRESDLHLHEIAPAVNAIAFEWNCYNGFEEGTVLTFKMVVDWSKIIDLTLIYEYYNKELMEQSFMLIPLCVNLTSVTIKCSVIDLDELAQNLQRHAGLRNVNIQFLGAARSNEVSNLFRGLAKSTNLENVRIDGVIRFLGIEFLETHMEEFLLACPNLNTLFIRTCSDEADKFIANIVSKILDRQRINTDFDLILPNVKEHLMEYDFLNSELLEAHRNMIYIDIETDVCVDQLQNKNKIE